MNPLSDPLVIPFGVYSLMSGFFAFLFFALPYSLLSWMDPPTARKYRIQKKRLTAGKVLWPALNRFVINMVVTFVVVVMCWPLLRLSGIHAGPAPEWYEVAWQIPAFLLIDDFLYYWLHRALHTRWLYKHVHSVHHRIPAPWAISGGDFHPVEYLLITATVLAGPILLGAHVITIWIWLIFRQWEAAEGHSGYEFPWSPTRWLPGYQGPAFHDFHHSEFIGNYANFFGYLDQWCGTLAKGYVDFRARAKSKN
jgi:4-alpha-methyl-delta7-sterol-4alpha-methyl oxidase